MKMVMMRVYLFPANNMKIGELVEEIIFVKSNQTTDTGNIFPTQTFLPTSQYHYLENQL